MKYQSELINEILEQRGHDKSSLHYQSECIETWIEETKGAYPKLCDYESEWLNYMIENPIGEFPYVTLTDVTEAIVDNVVPYAYKSAILTGSTKYRDIDTGEILDVFDETKNLELVSVKMPVLTTTGKNLIDKDKLVDGFLITDGTISAPDYGNKTTGYIKVKPNTTYSYSTYNIDKTLVGNMLMDLWMYYSDIGTISSVIQTRQQGINKTTISFTTPSDCKYLRIGSRGLNQEGTYVQLEESSTTTPYEPFKSNILTVNEDVTLRSNGDACDELDLLTGKLTQRIDEDGEVLVQEVVKTFELSITDENGKEINHFIPIEGTMHIQTDGEPIKPTVSMEIPVEAITQNLSSFIEVE